MTPQVLHQVPSAGRPSPPAGATFPEQHRRMSPLSEATPTVLRQQSVPRRPRTPVELSAAPPHHWTTTPNVYPVIYPRRCTGAGHTRTTPSFTTPLLVAARAHAIRVCAPADAKPAVTSSLSFSTVRSCGPCTHHRIVVCYV
jgi:hypothetical protein